MDNTQIITSNEDLEKLIKEGLFFNFCCGFALNKGYKDALKNREEIIFKVGDYNVEFNREPIRFEIKHRVYLFRVIVAFPKLVQFVGDSEDVVISELLEEFKKEINE